jgi:hypothetical protein
MSGIFHFAGAWPQIVPISEKYIFPSCERVFRALGFDKVDWWDLLGKIAMRWDLLGKVAIPFHHAMGA